MSRPRWGLIEQVRITGYEYDYDRHPYIQLTLMWLRKTLATHPGTIILLSLTD